MQKKWNNKNSIVRATIMTDQIPSHDNCLIEGIFDPCTSMHVLITFMNIVLAKNSHIRVIPDCRVAETYSMLWVLARCHVLGIT